jgi:hypothetical protein
VNTPAGLKAWLEENREYLFFSDVGAFRWFVDAYAKADAAVAREASATAGAGG